MALDKIAVRTGFLFAFFLAGQTLTQAALSPNLSLASESAVWLMGDSTLHPFTSRTTHMQLAYERDPQQVWKRFDLSIPVKELKSKDSALDKNMYKALKAEKCSSIDFHMSRYEMDVSTPFVAGLPVRAFGTLRVACHEQSVTLEGTIAQDQNSVRIQGQYSLLMSDYGVKPPTLMMGAIKVKDRVMIHFDLRLDDISSTRP